ncbi:MAG: energy transducer TonB [Bacteroidota bacterium]
MMVKRLLLVFVLIGMVRPDSSAQDSTKTNWGTIRIGYDPPVETVSIHVEQELYPVSAEQLNLYELPEQTGGPDFLQLYSPTATPREGQHVLFDFVVTKAGKVTLIRIHETTNVQHEKKVTEMLKQTRWRPAMKAGKILDCRYPVQIAYFKD